VFFALQRIFISAKQFATLPIFFNLYNQHQDPEVMIYHKSLLLFEAAPESYPDQTLYPLYEHRNTYKNRHLFIGVFIIRDSPTIIDRSFIDRSFYKLIGVFIIRDSPTYEKKP